MSDDCTVVAAYPGFMVLRPWLRDDDDRVLFDSSPVIAWSVHSKGRGVSFILPVCADSDLSNGYARQLGFCMALEEPPSFDDPPVIWGILRPDGMVSGDDDLWGSRQAYEHAATRALREAIEDDKNQ